MGEIGQVIKSKNNIVTVKMERTEACAKCGACSMGMKKEEMLIDCKNLCHAKLDDMVEISLEENNFFTAILIMYGIPFVSFVIGLAGGYYGFMKLGYSNSELYGFIIGMFFVILSYLWIRSKESYWKSKDFTPTAIKIVDKK